MPNPKARVRLTARSIAALKQAGTTFDDDLPRFAVRVTETGHKSFVIVARVAGRQCWRTVGTVGVMTLAAARERAREMLARVEAGEEPEPRPVGTFEAIAARFVAEYARRNRTCHDQERILRVYCAPWASRDIASITGLDVGRLLDKVAREHGPIMSNRTLSVVRKLFNWAAEPNRQIVAVSPVKGVKPVAKETPRDRTLSDAELRAFWRATGEMPYPWGPFFRLLALTGQRLSNVKEMRWQDIDLDLALWTVPRTKEGRRHEVPLSPAAMDILAGLPRFTGPFVFTTGNGTKPIRDLSGPEAKLKQAMPPCEQRWTPHDLRHTCSTVLARLGVAQQVNAKCLDHISGGLNSIDRIYNQHGYEAEKRDALERWARHLTADNVVTLRRA